MIRDVGRVIVIGAGPCGLGAAYRLQQLGYTAFDLFESGSGPGGLARSYLDGEGFTWDVGGHVQFSHYAQYDQVLDRALRVGWLHHQRESWIWLRGRFIPYPLQNNLHRLPAEDCRRALAGLERAAAQTHRTPPGDFRQWILRTFGEPLAELFFEPYNEKVWGYPLEKLGATWVGERVAIPDTARIRRNIREGQDDVSWGPNATFRFPLRGGTGAIWNGLARLLDPDRLHYGCEVVSVDLDTRSLLLASGERLRYDVLISTMPLDVLCERSVGLDSALRRAARELVYSAVHVVGIGIRGGRPASLEQKCWMYFPEARSPYHRVTVFSNYSPNNVPSEPECWSLMAEVSETRHRPAGARTEDRVLRALRDDGLIGPDAELVSVWHRREEHAYPTPFLARNRVLASLIPALERRGVFSRGRFGAWKYEVSNQDHAFMQGWEVVDRLLGDGDEPTLNRPEWVNAAGRPGSGLLGSGAGRNSTAALRPLRPQALSRAPRARHP